VSAAAVARAGALTFLLFVPSCTSAPRSRPLLPPAPPPVALAPAAADWPRREVLDLALRAYRCGDQERHFRRPILTVIDYSLPSNRERLWVIDVDREAVLHHELVAHGEGSGDHLAVAFSNRLGSHQSSLGLFRTDETYTGRFGYALRLSGLEPGFNDKARERAIVMHALADVSHEYAARRGTIATSWGCPALAPGVASRVIDRIAGGSAVFAYYPDAQWLRDSRYLHCDEQLALR
jgi:hypothetical protein